MLRTGPCAIFASGARALSTSSQRAAATFSQPPLRRQVDHRGVDEAGERVSGQCARRCNQEPRTKNSRNCHGDSSGQTLLESHKTQVSILSGLDLDALEGQLDRLGVPAAVLLVVAWIGRRLDAHLQRVGSVAGHRPVAPVVVEPGVPQKRGQRRLWLRVYARPIGSIGAAASTPAKCDCRFRF